jgi:homoserine kinase type II
MRGIKFAHGVIHGDLYFDNTLFNDNELTTVLDFEQSGRGLYILDIGISLSGTALKNDEVCDEYVDAYLEGYQKFRKIPQQEINLINKSIILGLFSIAVWRMERFIYKKIDPSKSDNYKELLERAEQFAISKGIL